MKKIISPILIGIVSIFLFACDSSNKSDPDEVQQTIVEVAVEAGNFTTLVAALEATGLDDVLNDPDSTYTVFAPSDDAFALLGQETIGALLQDPDTLRDILLYHVIADAEVLADAAISLASSDEPFATMVNADKAALSIGADANLYVNLAKVATPNVMASNGVIHVLDRVMLPPAASSEAPDLNIAETAVAAGNFETLLVALGAAGLDSVLADESGTFTVFAPTDDAFTKIDSATLESLLANTDALTSVLLQHVIVGAAVDSVTAFSLNNTSVNTESGEDVYISIEDGVLKIQGSSVIAYDIQTTNGVIHVIDTVITETLQ